MVTIRRAWIVLSLLLFTASVTAQYKNELEMIAGKHTSPSRIVKPLTSPEKFPNELSQLAIGAIRLYQRHISSQDIPVCNFTPSCSEYGAQALREYGVVLGSIMIADRLQRCNAMAREYYRVDPFTQLCIDPVSHNRLFK
jgi:putative membrane protein insertion efficiency factor